MPGANERRITVFEALRRRNTRTEFDELPTKSANTFLRVERGRRPSIPARKMARFITTAATNISRGGFINYLGGFQQKGEAAVKEFAAEHEGVRGVAFKNLGVNYNTTPRNSIDFRRDGLKEQLGSSYDTVVREELVLKVAVPLGRVSEMGVLTTEKIERLARAGLSAAFSPEEMDMYVQSEVKLKVDEPRLLDLAERGAVDDIEEVGVATETWAVDARAVNSTSS